MRSVYVECWHPTSYNTRVVVFRPWWRRKGSRYATRFELEHYRIDNTVNWMGGWRPKYMLSFP